MNRLLCISTILCGLSAPVLAQQTPTDWEPGTGMVQSSGSSLPSVRGYGDLSPAAGTPAMSTPAASSASAAPAAAMMPSLPRARDGEIIDSVGGDAIPALPLTVMSNGTMKYVTGGVGEEELAQLKSLENDFNIHMLVATKQGVFLSDVTSRVVDNKDTVLFTVENVGPYFYLFLPAGEYMVEITTPEGNMKSVKVKAPASGATKPVVRF